MIPREPRYPSTLSRVAAPNLGAALAALLVGCAASPAGLAPARSDSPAPRGGATALAQTTPAGDYSRPLTGRLTFTFGERQLDGALAPTDEPQAFGVEYSRLSAGGPLGFELGFQFADDQARGVALPGGGAGTVDRLQSEFFAGLRAEGGEGTLHPYLGLGATWLTNDTRIRSGGLEARDTDSRPRCP